MRVPFAGVVVLLMVSGGLLSGNVGNLSPARDLAKTSQGNYPTATLSDPPSEDHALLPTHRGEAPPLDYAVNGTMDLLNDTYLPGNQTFFNVVDPYAEAWDPIDGLAWVVDGSTGNLAAVNMTTLKVVQEGSVNFDPGGIGYDALHHELLLTDTENSSVVVLSVPLLQEVAQVTVGSDPHGLVYVNGSWFVGLMDGTVSVLNDSTWKVSGTISVGTQSFDLWDMAADPSAGRIFLSNAFSDNITEIDASTLQVAGSIAFGSSPRWIAVDPTNHRMAVQLYNAPSIEWVDTQTGSILATSAGGGMSGDGTWDAQTDNFYLPDGTDVAEYSGSTGSYLGFVRAGIPSMTLWTQTSSTGLILAIEQQNGNATVINASSLAVVGQPLTLGLAPGGVTYDPTTGRLFVETLSSQLLAVGGTTPHIEGSTSVWWAPSGFPPVDLAPGGHGEVFASTQFNISVYNSTTFQPVMELPGGDYPNALLYDATTDRVYESSLDGGVYGYDRSTGQVLGNASFGRATMLGMALDPLDGSLYIADPNGYSLQVVNATTFTNTTLPLPGAPFAVRWDGLIQKLLVCIGEGQDVDLAVIDPGTGAVEASIPISPNPGSIGYAIWVDPQSGLAYVVNQGGPNDLYVVDPVLDKVIDTVPVGQAPTGIAENSSDGTLYVSNLDSGTISFIDSPLGLSSFSAVPASPIVGNSTTLYTMASGGSGPLTLNYSGLPAGCSSSNARALVCNATTPGRYTLLVTVRDAGGASLSATTTLLVLPKHPLSVSGFGIHPSQVSEGTPVELEANVTGGITPLSESYLGLPSGCSITNQTNWFCIPEEAGSFVITLVVQDSIGELVEANATLSVIATLQVVSFDARPSTVELGASVTFDVNATGGESPRSYEYSDLPSGCSSLNEASLTCMPTETGAWTVQVNVTDASGQYARASAPFTVESPAGPQVTEFGASPASITVGNTTEIEVGVVGGTLPLSYSYSGLPSGCEGGNYAGFICRPSATGTFTLHLLVTDALGKSAQASATLTVLPPSQEKTGTSPAAPSYLWDGTWVAVVVASVAVGLWIVARRHRPPSSPDPGPLKETPPPQNGERVGDVALSGTLMLVRLREDAARHGRSFAASRPPRPGLPASARRMDEGVVLPRGWGFLAALLLAICVAVPSIGGQEGGPSHPTSLSREEAQPSLAVVPGERGPPSSSDVGQVNETLCLSSNTLLPGTNTLPCPNSRPAPQGLAFDPVTGTVFVTNQSNGPMVVISATSDRVIAKVPTNGSYGIAYDADTNTVYTDTFNATATAVNASTLQIEAYFNITGVSNSNPAVDPRSGEVFFPTDGVPSVEVVSDTTNARVALTGTGYDSWDSTYDPRNGDIYVPNEGSNNVTVINGTSNRLVLSIPVGAGPEGSVFDPDNGDVYVSDAASNSITVISSATNVQVANISGVYSPWRMAFDGGNGDIYASESGVDGTAVSVISGVSNSLLGNISGLHWPSGIAYDPVNGNVYVAGLEDGVISIIPTVPAPVALATPSIEASETSIETGQALYVNVSATGGSPPYTFAYSGLPPGCHSQNVSSLVCTPDVRGMYNVTVSVTDRLGVTRTSAPLMVEVTGGAPSASSSTWSWETIAAIAAAGAVCLGLVLWEVRTQLGGRRK